MVSVYLIVAISVLIIRAVFKRLPGLIVFFALAPVAPFMVAWENRKKSPVISCLLFVVWLAFFLLTAIIIIAGK